MGWYSACHARHHRAQAVLWRKNGPKPLNIYYELPELPLTASRVDTYRGHHDAEGRVILVQQMPLLASAICHARLTVHPPQAEFDNVFLLHTYTPNNGCTAKSYARRERVGVDILFNAHD